MFAVIQAQGHQFRVEPGVEIELDGTGEAGASVSFDNVLLVGTDGGDVMTGTPTVAGAKVVGVVIDAHRGPKVRIFKKKRRKQVPPHGRPPQRAHARAHHRHRRVTDRGPAARARHGIRSWQRKKVREVLETGATASPSGWA